MVALSIQCDRRIRPRVVSSVAKAVAIHVRADSSAASDGHAIVTAFADDPVGRLLQDLLYQGGVGSNLTCAGFAHDGVGAPREKA